jgi:hypothetical protein
MRDMKLPHLPARKNSLGKLSKQDEEVFAQAKELASLRLEQCIADLAISAPTVKDTNRHPLKKLDLL